MKLVIADTKTGKSHKVELDAGKAKPLNGMKMGDVVDGALLGLAGYKMVITGGTNKEGFPMRKDVAGMERAHPLLAGGTGFRPHEKGERRRKTVRGNTIGEDIAQLNLKITEYGQQPLPEEKKGEETAKTG